MPNRSIYPALAGFVICANLENHKSCPTAVYTTNRIPINAVYVTGGYLKGNETRWYAEDLGINASIMHTLTVYVTK